MWETDPAVIRGHMLNSDFTFMVVDEDGVPTPVKPIPRRCQKCRMVTPHLEYAGESMCAIHGASFA